jgi:hypothetical protein
MKLSTVEKLTTAEAIAILSNHLGVKVEIVDEDCGWVINTKTSCGHPYDLQKDDKIEIVGDSGDHEIGLASDWLVLWDMTNSVHIVKYRKVK